MNPELILSVVVSCYKQEAYIAQCLNSIFDQKVNFKYEIIIADDCSPDRTRDVILTEVAQYTGVVRLLFNDINVGAARNYLSLHEQARGKYVAHMDGDDVMLAGKLQSQVDVMERNPECNIVFHRSRYFSDDGSYLSDTGSLFGSVETVAISPNQLARWGTIAAHSTYMYRRSTRKTHEYRRDFMEWFFAFEAVLNGGVGAYINTIYLKYRCNPIGDSYLASRNGRAKAYMIIIQHVIDYFEEYPEFRSDLYAQQLVNVLMYIKNIRRIRWFMLWFLLKHSYLFRVGKVSEVIRVRRMVGPFKKIR